MTNRTATRVGLGYLFIGATSSESGAEAAS